jgi:hypothetical protein
MKRQGARPKRARRETYHELMRQGLKIPEIAARLRVSERTINRYKREDVSMGIGSLSPAIPVVSGSDADPRDRARMAWHVCALARDLVDALFLGEVLGLEPEDFRAALEMR